MQHETGKAFIGDENVATAGKDEQRLVVRCSPIDRFANIVHAPRLEEILRWAADPQRRKRSQRNVALQGVQEYPAWRRKNGSDIRADWRRYFSPRCGSGPATTVCALC